ncbi:MAG: Mur ligase family protein [Paludibacter sp.]
MQRVHFIAIGGVAMHNLAITICKKNNFEVTGSDEEFTEPVRRRLEEYGLLPDKLGWFPDKINKGLSAVVIGINAKEDNPELIRAKELGLKIYSVPEYLFLQTRSKTRIVVSGSHGKTTVTAMILFVLKNLKIDADYMISSQIEGFDNMVKLTYESRIAVFEGDEFLTSPIDRRPKFHLYKPHIAVLTGIKWDHINVFPTLENYVQQFRKFTELMEVQGRLIYFDGDEQLNKMAETLRRDIVSFAYNTPDHEVRNGVTYLKTRYGEILLQVFGQFNLQNLDAARLACRQIGVTDEQFYSVISEFPGVSNRLEKIAESNETIVYRDFAHSPTQLKATIKAVKNQHPDRKLIACFELQTVTSLTDDFLPQYANCMAGVDVAFVYFNPDTVKQLNLNKISSSQVKAAFGGENLTVFTDPNEMQQSIRALKYENSVLLFMTSGTFDGLNLTGITKN